jgi:hypothetical protein
MTETSDSVRRQTLVRLAKRLQITDRQAAAGVCLSLSMELALWVRARCGADVRLVRWRVVGDPQYLDHWAVEFDADRVVDLTRVQVDGSRALICPVDGYPLNYTHRSSYPVSLFEDAYAASGGSSNERLADRFLWRCGVRRFGADLGAAYHGFDLRGLLAALGEFARFVEHFAVGMLTRALARRAHELLRRASVHTEFSALTLRGGVRDEVPEVEFHASSVVDLEDYKARHADAHGADAARAVRSQRRPHNS